MITAFAERGLLQTDWAPRLVIDVEGREFEVSEKISLPPVPTDLFSGQILLDNQEDVQDRSDTLILAPAPSIRMDSSVRELISQDPA
jgi:hypothetical protein